MRFLTPTTGTDMVVMQKLRLDAAGKRLDDYGHGYEGIMSRVKVGQIVVAALGFPNTIRTGVVLVLLMPSINYYEAIKTLENNGFQAWYALDPRKARSLGLKV